LSGDGVGKAPFDAEKKVQFTATHFFQTGVTRSGCSDDLHAARQLRKRPFPTFSKLTPQFSTLLFASSWYDIAVILQSLEGITSIENDAWTKY